MGDYSDYKMAGRIMECPAGRARLDQVRNALQGRSVTSVQFSNEIHAIGVHLGLDDGQQLLVFLPELQLTALVESQVIATQECELYYQEYPSRRDLDSEV